MRKRDDIIIGAVIFLLLAVIFALIYYSRPLQNRSLPMNKPDQQADEPKNNSGKNTAPANQMSPKDKKEYQENVSRIFNSLRNFFTQMTDVNADEKNMSRLTELKNELLAQRVPANYRNLHLELVITLDKIISQNPKEDTAAFLTQEKNVLDKLSREYSWLDS